MLASPDWGTPTCGAGYFKCRTLSAKRDLKNDLFHKVAFRCSFRRRSNDLSLSNLPRIGRMSGCSVVGARTGSHTMAATAPNEARIAQIVGAVAPTRAR